MLKTTKQKGKENIRKSRKRGAREQGITLVALVITIIIIIILATVTINMAFGDNGLIRMAQKAKDVTANSIEAEREEMNSVMSEYLNVMAEDSEIPLPQEDTTPPTVEITVGERTENSIAITVNATDDSGEIASYKYYLNGTLKDTLTSNSYTFTGLTAGTDYTIKVEAYDKAGNKGEKSTTASTTAKTVANTLVAGDYVTYPSPSGNLACRVLYDSSSEYGVQLITSDTVTDSYTLGADDDFDGNKTLYNNVISTLNSAVSSYNNSTYSTVRCVGSVPNNPSQDSAGYYTFTKFSSSYDGQFKDTDTNYKADYDQMGTLGIRNIGKSYWLASRNVRSLSNFSEFGVRTVNSSGSLRSSYLCSVISGGSTDAYSHSYGLRPCFTLKSGIKVTGGDGTSAGTAYTLGV